jgi:hydroxypyruvate isomerase
MRMMKIVKSFGYTGYVGVEYEGERLSEEDGIKATRDLLIKIGQSI